MKQCPRLCWQDVEPEGKMFPSGLCLCTQQLCFSPVWQNPFSTFCGDSTLSFFPLGAGPQWDSLLRNGSSPLLISPFIHILISFPFVGENKHSRSTDAKHYVSHHFKMFHGYWSQQMNCLAGVRDYFTWTATSFSSGINSFNTSVKWCLCLTCMAKKEQLPFCGLLNAFSSDTGRYTRGHLRQTAPFSPIPTQNFPCGNHPSLAICYFHHTWPRSITSLLLFSLLALSFQSSRFIVLPNFPQSLSNIKLRFHSTFIPLYFLSLFSSLSALCCHEKVK